MSDQMTLPGIPSATSSPASEAGALPFDSPDGPMTGPSGPAPAPASPSAPPARARASRTSATSGPPSSGLIRERRPERVFGEQVASNLAWLDLVQGDLEGEGYAVGSAIVGAHSVGAPHIRQRLYWVADSGVERRQQVTRGASRDEARMGGGRKEITSLQVLAETFATGWPTTTRQDAASSGAAGYSTESGRHSETTLTDAARSVNWLGDGERTGLEGCERSGQRAEEQRTAAERASAGDAWGASRLVECADGRLRPVPTEPGLFPWLMGFPAEWDACAPTATRSSPQVAAAFIRAAVRVD